MKEEMLEAIYGTVERLEQKVDELSASPKNAGAETVPASNDTTRLENSIIAMFGKEEEAIGKISKLRDAIGIFADLIKAELGKNEQRSKFLVDAVKQMRQEKGRKTAHGQGSQAVEVCHGEVLEAKLRGTEAEPATGRSFYHGPVSSLLRHPYR